MSMEEKIDQAKGAVKEGVGKLTGDKKIEKEGAAEKAAAKVKEVADDVQDAIEGTIQGVKNIVNKEKEKEKITVTVTKKWENPDGTPLTGDKPTISLQLLKDGKPEGDPVELTNGNITYEWKNLDKID